MTETFSIFLTVMALLAERGLRRTPLLRSRLRLPLRPPIRTSRAEQNRLGGDGIPGLHPDVRAVGLVRTDVAGRTAGAVLSLPGALPPAGLHLPAADPRKGENAPRNRADGHGLQHAQRPDAGADGSSTSRLRTITPTGSHSPTSTSAGRCSWPAWPSTSIRTTSSATCGSPATRATTSPRRMFRYVSSAN